MEIHLPLLLELHRLRLEECDDLDEEEEEEDDDDDDEDEDDDDELEEDDEEDRVRLRFRFLFSLPEFTEERDVKRMNTRQQEKQPATGLLIW